LMIVSGDQEEPTRRLAAALGLDRYFANVLPEGKATLVDQLQSEGRSVCFVGDGINDAIALKKAKVSVSLRGATMVATDVAQVILMQESLRQLPFLFQLGDDMHRSMRLGLAAGIIPGAINVAGVFVLGWGFYPSIVLSMSSVIATMGIAMYPAYKYKQLQHQIDARDRERDLAMHGARGPQVVPGPQVVAGDVAAPLMAGDHALPQLAPATA